MAIPYFSKVEALVTGAMTRITSSSEVKDGLTFLSTDGGKVELWEEQGETMLIPRRCCPVGILDRRTDGDPFVQVIAKPPRNQEQVDIIKDSFAALQVGTDHMIEAPTGFGKTYVGAAIASKLGKRVLIVVTKEDLLAQWRNTLLHLIGVKASDIGLIQQDSCEYEKPFVIGMLHSLVIPGRYPKEMYEAFGLIIFDEVHRLGAETFSEVCRIFPARHRLGLSATPKRWDGKERVFEAHLGPVMFRGLAVPMNPKVLVKRTAWKIPKGWQKDEHGQWVMETMKITPARMTHIVKKLAADPARNAVIAQFVASAYKAGRHIVIMSDLIDGHLKPLFHILAKVGIPGEDMDFYIGGRTEAELKSAKMKKVVLATYAYTAEGTDVPEWDTLVMATPRSNVKQSIGRVLRSMEGKKQPVILDLVDDHSVFSAFHQKRVTQYFQVGATIVKVA